MLVWFTFIKFTEITQPKTPDRIFANSKGAGSTSSYTESALELMFGGNVLIYAMTIKNAAFIFDPYPIN